MIVTRPLRPSDLDRLNRTAPFRVRPRLQQAIWGNGEDLGMTASVVVDDPRQPRLEATGVLDARGKMLVRVIMPIKAPLGFQTPGRQYVEDELEAIVPEDLLRVSTQGGVGSIRTAEGEDDEYEYDDE